THNPFMYFRSITENPSQCSNVVPFSSAARDLADGTAPPFLWVTPDVCHDGGTCNDTSMDTWLQDNLPQFLTSSWYQENGEIVITWDEAATNEGCCGGAFGGHIPTIVMGGSTAPMTSSVPLTHAGLLGTLEDLFDVQRLRD